MSEFWTHGTRARQPGDPLRILWLKTGPLHPVDTGGKIRTFNMLRELRRKNPLTYLSLWPEGTPESARKDAHQYSDDQIWIPWREAPKRSLRFVFQLGLNFAGSQLPYAIQKYLSRAWAAEIRHLDGSGKFDLIVCDFLTPAVNLYAGDHRPQTPVLLFQHNVESLIWQRH